MNSTPSIPADLNLDDPQTLPGLFSRVAARMPQRIAVQYGRACITYAELELLSNRVADWLHRQHRVEHGDLVCIAYPRGIDFMVAMLGALKCGAAYVPIDLREPLERRRAIVEDAAPKCLLVVIKGSRFSNQRVNQRVQVRFISKISVRLRKKEIKMISVCDGCQQLFDHELKTINAKEWDSSLCKVSVKKSYDCNLTDCDYSLDGECCVEFQFCESCLNSDGLDKRFLNFIEINGDLKASDSFLA
ncbi:AMP-binding protein [Thiorhodovibrio frisius]|nr:AMP-binding protein [Thiorhodovibrio frisius]